MLSTTLPFNRELATKIYITTSFYLDCPLMLSIPVVKFRSYSNGTMTSLSTTSETIVCCNNVWPTTNAMGKMYKMQY